MRFLKRMFGDTDEFKATPTDNSTQIVIDSLARAVFEMAELARRSRGEEADVSADAPLGGIPTACAVVTKSRLAVCVGTGVTMVGGHCW